MSLPKLPKIRCLNLPEGMVAEDLHQSLPDPYSLIEVETHTLSRRYFDTFDWRLKSKGFLAVLHGEVLGIYRFANGEVDCAGGAAKVA